MRQILLIFLFALSLVQIQGQQYRKAFFDNDSCFILPEDNHYTNYINTYGFRKETLTDGQWLEIKNGKIVTKFSIKQNLLNGAFITFDEDGTVNSIGQYERGAAINIWKYYSHGKLRVIKFYNSGIVNETNTYYDNGQLENRTINMEQGKGDGLRHETKWYENGLYMSQGQLVYNNECEKKGNSTWYKDGIWNYWHSNGRLESKGAYRAGVKVGEWCYYDLTGILIKTELYKKCELFQTIDYSYKTSNGNNVIVCVVRGKSGNKIKTIEETFFESHIEVKTIDNKNRIKIKKI